MITAPPGRTIASSDGRPEEHEGSQAHDPHRRMSGGSSAFEEMARVHDRLNSILSLGQQARWRAAAVAAAAVRPGDAVIDVAAGTGKVATALAETVGPFGRVTAVDISRDTVDRGISVTSDLVQLEFVVADALALPFRDGEFDAAMICFGLRDMPDPRDCLRELRRVVRPGGRVVCLELTLRRQGRWAKVERAGLQRATAIAGSLSRRRHASSRLWASISRLPDAETLAELMASIRLVDVDYRRLGLGAVALHVATVAPA